MAEVKRRLVSFLGLGGKEHPHYSEVRYEWEGRCAEPTPLVCRAIAELIGDVDDVVVLGTEKVRERWIDRGQYADLLGRSFEFRLVPDGKSEEELREVFTTLLGAFGLPSIEGALDPVESLLVDVTHGFRIQPILGASAIAFALSEWQRLGLEVPDLRVLYGAYDAANDGPTPLWDLTEIVTVARYNAALDALVRYGRADDLEGLTRADAKGAVAAARAEGEQGRGLGRHSHLGRLGQASRRFADDLALGRARDLFRRSAPELRDRLSDPATDSWLARLPFLKGAFTTLRETVGGVCADDVFGTSGRAATVKLAQQYGKTQRFAEQAATLREGLVTEFGRRRDAGPQAEPGTPGCREARESLGTELSALARGLQQDEPPAELASQRELVKLSADVGSARNDIEHLGLNDAPMQSTKLRRVLETYTERFGELLEPDLSSSVEEESGAADTFVNLSNHPVRSWPQAQREAVTSLGFPEAVDLSGGMALVEPHADEAAVSSMAAEIAERTVARGARGAYVAGEFTLVFALVQRLQERGVRCYAAVTRRSVEEVSGADGVSVRRSEYEFLRFREYSS